MIEKKKKTRKQKIATGIGILFGLVLLFLAIIMVYLNDYYKAEKSFPEYQMTSRIQMEEGNRMIKLSPIEGDNHTGIIFYPGGKVEYTAYVPLLEELVSLGYTCYLCQMPGNLAIFDHDRAADIIQMEEDITTWYLAGHSLGGAMASSYAKKNPNTLEGLIFLAAYAAFDLSKENLDTLSIAGSNDQVLNWETYEENKAFAPASCKYLLLEGANHGGFGDYGEQDGDGEATITKEEQWKLTAKEIDLFIKDRK